MRKFLCLFLIFFSSWVFGDNLRLDGDVKIVSVSSGVADLEVRVSWFNSWRNSCNYDAVYLFGKFCVQGSEDAAWHHVFFHPSEENHSAGTGYGLSVVNGGRGLFVYRSEEGQGESQVLLRLQWQLDGNPEHPVTAGQVTSGEVLLSLQGLEMVYVPTSPFYMGDGLSAGSFRSSSFGVLPASSDLIGTSSNFVYSASSNSNYASRAADRQNNAKDDGAMSWYWSNTSGNYPAWWQVDFKSEKKILYFGVSGLCRELSSPAPGGTWYLEGSPTAAAGSWGELWSGGPEHWGESAISYPVQQALRVTSPGSYRYYRIRVEDSQRKDFWNNISIANVAMTEEDLSESESGGVLLQDGCSNDLPEDYADGVRGFYAMKYELTQEQYVTFLNRLPRSAQYTRTIGGLLDGIKEGEYVYGDLRTAPSCRNGIIVQERRLNSSSPYLFACNLNPLNVGNSLDDGQTLACNYLSPADLLAYADWSGLRPLSELEYEKMCRGLYPVVPVTPDYAWGESAAVAGSGWTDLGKETERAGAGNVNAGGILSGPCRVGSFVRSGTRAEGGNSFLGIADLSGNLSEIYVNTEMYGRPFSRRAAGSGELTVSGDATVGRQYWPLEVEAYGLRGGDFSSATGDLTVANRSQMVHYFGQLTEAFPQVGIRLGLSCEPGTMETILTLENGLSSGNDLVSDTVCDASDYTIKGTALPVQQGHYFWFRSTDNGESWQRLEGCTDPDLTLKNLTVEVQANAVQSFRYKRRTYTLNSYSESGSVGLVVSHGFQLDRLRDTLQPCMASHGFTITTRLPSAYEWTCLDNKKQLEANLLSSGSSQYVLQVKDFQQQGEEWPSGLYTLDAEITVAGKCKEKAVMEVQILPYTANPFPEKLVTYTYDGNNTYQIANIWGGADPQTWTLKNDELGSLLVSDRGLLSNVSTTLCRHITVEAVCKDFPDKVYQMELHEPARQYSSAGAYTLSLLPGEYSFECWGGRGSQAHQNGYNSGTPGNGGYAYGELDIDQQRPFYLYVGGAAGAASGRYGGAGGWNGGANGGYDSDDDPGGGGGGASDIRVVGGAWNDALSLRNRIMVAGGGGGCGWASAGGNGGGLEGVRANSTANATQTSGAAFGWASAGGNGGSGYTGAGGGGGGYYGGWGAPGSSGGGGGGAGFISGMTGCNAVDESGVHTGQPNHFSGMVFKNPAMTVGGAAGRTTGAIKITVK